MIQDLQERFLDQSAPYWRDNLDMRAIFRGQASELVHADNLISTYLLNELYLDSATEWGLSLIEHRYGLTDDEARTIDERRDRIRAVKRGQGNATIEEIKLIASSFAGGTVDVSIDYDNFVVTVEFVDQFGVPTRIADVQAALDKAFPSHYEIFYNYRFNSYRDIKLYFSTYQSLIDARLSYRQLLLTDQQIPSYVDFKSDLTAELNQYLNESKSIMLSTSYLNYRGLN